MSAPPAISALPGDELDQRPVVRDPAALGIGCVGSGNIVANAHIPAYLAAGMKVVAITSRTKANAEAVAKQHGIGAVHDSVEALVADPNVHIVDIALPPDLQPEVVHKAIAAGKHVLAQKPLAVTFKDCAAMVAAAEQAGVSLAVNQNGRWDPSINASRQLIAGGVLGTRLTASITMHITMPWQSYYQDPKYDRLMILNMSVHHIDQFRWLFGDPASVFAIARTVPGQAHFGETIAQYILAYDDGFFATGHDDGTNWSRHLGINYRVQGTEGVLVGEIGWPRLTHSTVKYQRRGEGAWIEPEFTRMWFPDAFSATMGELMSAVEQQREPANSGRDNLATMRAVFAAYRSMSERRAVELDEITQASD